MLQDGSVFDGIGFGYPTDVTGEVVFNTGMVGYTETLTDPSYRGQILCLTYPLIGNYGVPDPQIKDEFGLSKYFESDNIQVKGLLIHNLTDVASHWSCVKTLDQWLFEEKIPGISDIDTRELTKRLRIQGVMNGAIRLNQSESYITSPSNASRLSTSSSRPGSFVSSSSHSLCSSTPGTSPDCSENLKILASRRDTIVDEDAEEHELSEKIKKHSYEGENFMLQVSATKPQIYVRRVRRNYSNNSFSADVEPPWSDHGNIVLLDTGTKYSIIRNLIKSGFTVVRLPWDTSYKEILSYKPKGVVISNGPGDPKVCKSTIATASLLIKSSVPTLGICLGNQILALAAGAETYKLKFGHRGQNKPCRDIRNKLTYITSQNHGYGIDPKSLEKTDFKIWFSNIDDDTVEGIEHSSKPIIAVQFHPEASPGPYDCMFVFDRFKKMIMDMEDERESEKSGPSFSDAGIDSDSTAGKYIHNRSNNKRSDRIRRKNGKG